ncbi:MAG TPA: hypothetical protein VFJ94_12635 [Intrasporangium sp.]|uniref:hypothetical protein n=1 Tax=Intrasporangium sp. TaxID=1925024 RepID=UPI002D776620|nr:hypothetical protein [Intrasporangium sp.]HET7399357.1 hypothetical protein [Intrasporangium sp.]
MNQRTIITSGAAILAAAGLALGGAALANADQSSGTAPAATQGAYGPAGDANGVQNGNTDPSKPMRSDEKLLTGDTAAKVTAAAKAKEPGATIERVETDSDGVYEAHMVRADGTHIIVQVDASYAVTAVQQGGAGGGARHGGPAPSSGSTEGGSSTGTAS